MPNRKVKIEFAGSQGDLLAGLLEQPESDARAWVLFAHCFTCGKDIAAASRISRALVARGFAVMRFDFTGLGNSDGDFANTNFSSNVQDLVHAADYLRENHSAPVLMIGHSLGGTAVLKAAHKVAECRGVVTIGSPASATHIEKQFQCDLDTITQDGKAEVNLAGRAFTIKKQFLDDIRDNSDINIDQLKKALLILHSPIDSVVSIQQAQHLYQNAKHPKSFISLDNADHLLTNKNDSDYAAEIISAWASRFTSPAQPGKELSASAQSGQVKKGTVRVVEKDRKFTQDVFSSSHQWLADEPVAVGGQNLGPDPYEHLLAALGTCTSMTMRMYATRKKWPVDRISVDLMHSRDHGQDCIHCDETHPQIDVINRSIDIVGDLDQDQRDRLLQIADLCPVHKTLHGKLLIKTEPSDKNS